MVAIWQSYTNSFNIDLERCLDSISLANILVMAQADVESGDQFGNCIWEWSIGEGNMWYTMCPYCNHYWVETDDIVALYSCTIKL